MAAAPPEADLHQAVAREKAFQAEHNTAWVRLAIIAFNILVYYLVIDPAQTIPWLARLVVAVAGTYAVFIVTVRPYVRFPVLRAAWFTAVSDAALITAWITATGGVESPFYGLWFISLFAVAFRFDAFATMGAACTYLLCDVGIVAWDGGLDPDDGLVREVYIIFAGILGALLGHVTMLATRQQVEMRAKVQDAEVRRLQEMSQLKTNLLNTASHELNTPLTPIRMQMHLLRSGTLGPLTPGQERAVKVLDRNVARLAGLVRDVLDVARLESGHLLLQLGPTALGEAAQEAVEAFEATAAHKGVQLTSTVPAAVARADHDRIVQVLLNLVGNAVKFTPAGGRIEVGGAERDGVVHLWVKDTGMGLTTAQAERLFRPFSQVHDESLAMGGTGLGLFISHGIVTQHGGRLWVESPGKDQGATFHVEVPKAGPPPSAAAPYGPPPISLS